VRPASPSHQPCLDPLLVPYDRLGSLKGARTRDGNHVMPTTMIARFRQTAAGLQCNLIETLRIDGKVRHEIVASLGSVPASPSVADRIAFWRRVYETLAELANQIDAETQGKIISAWHSRIPIVTPDEQRVTRVRPRPPPPQKASRDHEVSERPQSEAKQRRPRGTRS
jgi:hypothetical protein